MNSRSQSPRRHRQPPWWFSRTQRAWVLLDTRWPVRMTAQSWSTKPADAPGNVVAVQKRWTKWERCSTSTHSSMPLYQCFLTCCALALHSWFSSCGLIQVCSCTTFGRLHPDFIKISRHFSKFDLDWTQCCFTIIIFLGRTGSLRRWFPTEWLVALVSEHFKFRVWRMNLSFSERALFD